MNARAYASAVVCGPGGVTAGAPFTGAGAVDCGSAGAQAHVCGAAGHMGVA